MTRLFRLSDPLISIIYISPFELSPDLISYYKSQLKQKNILDLDQRLIFLSPSTFFQSLSGNISLSLLLSLDSKKLAQLKKHVKSKTCYMVPGIIEHCDIQLSNSLNTPLLAGRLDSHRSFRNKSQIIDFLNQEQIPTAIGMIQPEGRSDMCLQIAKVL